MTSSTKQPSRPQEKQLPTSKEDVQRFFSKIIQKHTKDDPNPKRSQQALARVDWDGWKLYFVYSKKPQFMVDCLRQFGFDPKMAKAVANEARARIEYADTKPVCIFHLI
jgi:hypothetical protein